MELKLFPAKCCLKVLPTYAVSYSQPLTERFVNRTKLPVLNKTGGSVSNKAATKIRNAVNWTFYFAEKKKVYSIKEGTTFTFYLNFITLTLPTEQKHSDEFIKENMLEPFLYWLNRAHGNQMYVWKAERQANDRIHFHITTHTFIHWMSIRKKWNVLLSKYGYCKVFQNGSNDKGNAATQIKAAKTPENVGGYLAAYVGKNDKTKLKISQPKQLPAFKSTTKFSDTASNYCYAPQSVLKRPIEGRLWGCSYNLSRINATIDDENDTYETLNDHFTDLNSIAEKTKAEKYYTLYLYRNLKFKSVPSNIEYLIRSQINLHPQKKYYKIDSLFEDKKK